VASRVPVRIWRAACSASSGSLFGQAPLDLARRAVDLVHLVAVPAEESGQPDAVGAGALDPEGDQPALQPGVACGDVNQVREALGGGR
jgi:hypothetical protein